MKWARNTLILLATVGGMVFVPIAPAAASVGLSSSLTVPQATSVGSTGVAGSITAINTNSAPHSTESNLLTSVRIAPSCASAPSGANPCPTPDPGVFSIASTATGRAGTACAGVTFTASAPDASGIVTFTPSVQVTLGPPGGAPGSDRCTVDFTFSVLKVPTVDVNAGTNGVQTFFNARITAMSAISGLNVATNPSLQTTVVKATSPIVTQASPSVVQGGTIFDTATIASVGGLPAPTGTVTFQLFGPNDATCVGPAVGQSTNPVVNGTAQSDNFTATQLGTYRFVAAYSGDANYNAVSSACNDVNEQVVVTPRRQVADFDGDGDTDVSVYRPGSGQWFVNGVSSFTWGVEGDIPVPADYSGSSIVTEAAIYRPSTGQWFIRGGNPGLVTWGSPGDTPVPADYTGDGRADIAVYRPSTGQWFVMGGNPAVVVWGTADDIPVPADYTGDGKAEIAVYRPSTGQWFILGGNPSVVTWGSPGDIPVPADYNGDGRTDIAVYRPSTGQWFIQGGSPSVVTWGASGDIPSPGDYTGDGRADIAVYRPSTGQWFILGGTPSVITWGGPGDIPLPLPYAIRRAFF